MNRRTNKTNAVQMELFGSDIRTRTDKELIADLTTDVDKVADYWEECYRIESLFNHLTPSRRRIAEAAIELYKRREVRQRQRIQLTSSERVYQLMKPLLADLPNEEVWVIGLNSRFAEIAKGRISIGGLSDAPADIRIIARMLIEWQATACILVHNHPSGSMRPSMDDRTLTKHVDEALKVLRIKLADHVIVSSEGYYSFNDEGDM
jgi:DNA repair protein RadC